MTKYPLTWPAGWRRTKHRKRAAFNRRTYQASSTPGGSGYFRSSDLSIADGTARLLKSLEMLGAVGEAIISSNVALRLDGLPRSGQAEPSDPGVAVYWKVKTSTTHRVMAIDLYDRVADNLAAIAATLEGMRAIERHGGAVILDRAFVGFTALPSPNDWRHVLGFEHTPSFDEAKKRFKELALKHHSDTGGSDVRMAELIGAWDAAQRELA